jgi:hypothetical protein
MEKGDYQVNVVNHAIDLREQGREAETQQRIARLKQARPTWKIKIAIAVLDGDDAQAHLLLTHAAKQKKL